MVDNPYQTIIQLREVFKAYETGAQPFVALRNVNLDINQGEFLGITGKSGAGKTTLLNMISGISELTSGEVQFFDGWNSSFSIHDLSEDKLAEWRGKNVGIVYQSFELIPTLSLLENVMLPRDFLGSYRPQISRARAMELLELVEISEHAHKIPAHISGGQKQRVAIARALVNDPALIIADEPTGNLDSVTAETIYQLFEKLVDRGRTVVMVTHDESLTPRFSRRMQIVDGVLGHPSEFETPRGESAKLSGQQEIDYGSAVENVEIEQPNRVGYRTKSSMPRPDHPAIVLHGVDKIFSSPVGEFQALKSIDMLLNYGQFISIVGKSGSGKSTLLNMITGIDHPTAGEVIVGDQHIYKLSKSDRALWRGRNMGVVFQFFQLMPTLSLLENTMLPMDYCNVLSFSERPKRAMELLSMVGLEEQAHKLPGSVSSGQQQSAAIARALANDPDLILADEPTGNLDSRSAANILNLFEQMAADGKTILIVTHDPSITKRTDQTIILSDGEIIDQTIARALPYLSHPEMLEATHLARKKKYKPGELILQQGKSVNHFCMITSGEVEIVVNQGRLKERSLARLGSGQFFGEIELIRGGKSVASVRAADDGAEIAFLSREKFFSFVDGSPLTRNELQEIADARLSENKKRKRRRKTDR
jgi:ABC-type lipoprotein export system ATPase subunit